MHIAYKFPKEKKGRRLDFAGPKNSSDLLGEEGDGREKNTGNYQRGLFLPFNNCAQMSSAPKKRLI